MGPALLLLSWDPSSLKILKIIFYVCLGTKKNVIQLGFIIIIFIYPLILKEIKMKTLPQVPKLGLRYHAAACLMLRFSVIIWQGSVLVVK